MNVSIKVMKVFKKLTANPYQYTNINDVINEELDEIKEVLLNKDAETLKTRLSGGEYLADTGKVTTI